MRDNLIKKANSILGAQEVQGLLSASTDHLKSLIVTSASAIEEVKNDLKANENYLRLIENKKLLESGLREVLKTCNTKIKLAVTLLQERGQ